MVNDSNAGQLALTDNHPTYLFPTIREVVCEIHFKLDSSWKEANYSDYFKRIEPEFPTFEPVALPAAVQSDSSPGELVIPLVIRYKHKSENLLIQLAQNRLVINVLPVYPGWEQVCKHIIYAWSHLQDVASPMEITRIGLRYINSIARSETHETLGKWLISSPYISDAVLDSQKNFVMRISKRLSQEDRIQVLLAEQASAPNDLGTYIFDIDRIVEKKISSDNVSLLAEADRLHNDVWEVFSSAKSEKLDYLLKGEFE